MNNRFNLAMTIIVAAVSLGGCGGGGGGDTDPQIIPAPDPQNSPPSIAGTPPAVATVGTAYSFKPSANDPDGDPLVFDIQNRPIWASFNTATGDLAGTPQPGDEGIYSDIRITASDGLSSAALSIFAVDVEPRAASNNSPTISGTPPSSLTVGMSYSFTPTASDPDGDSLAFSIVNRPAWATFDNATGTLSGTPQSGDEGSYANITISVSDGQLSASLRPFSITVNPPVMGNSAPSISGTPFTTVTAGTSYSFTPSAFDADGDPLLFGIQNIPGWAAFDNTTGTLSGVPQPSDEGTSSGIIISVTDGMAFASLPGFSLTVISATGSNRAPVIFGNPKSSADVGAQYVFTPMASDPDGDTLTFSILNRPTWATFDGATGTLSGTPASTDVGTTANITISVNDGELTATLPNFSITVGGSNTRPSISGSPATSVTTGESYDFTPSASDPEGDTLTFTIANRPSWATFNSLTGRLTGTPDSTDEGTYGGIVITVSDGDLSASLPAFTITVSGSNAAPTISGTPGASVIVDERYTFTPTASDPNGDTLSFSIVNLPSWASFDTPTGTLTGTPAAGDEGTYENITITVSDGELNASLPPFTITVNAIATGSVTLMWTPPTRNDDGSLLTDLAGYRFYYGTSSGNYTMNVLVNDSGISNYRLDNLTPNTYYIVATSVNSSGVESEYSSETVKVVVAD